MLSLLPIRFSVLSGVLSSLEWSVSVVLIQLIKAFSFSTPVLWISDQRRKSTVLERVIFFTSFPHRHRKLKTKNHYGMLLLFAEADWVVSLERACSLQDLRSRFHCSDNLCCSCCMTANNALPARPYCNPQEHRGVTMSSENRQECPLLICFTITVHLQIRIFKSEGFSHPPLSFPFAVPIFGSYTNTVK